VVNKYITITIPKIGEVVKFGERQYYSMVQTISAIPSEMKSQLWDMGLDWTQITDFQLFMMLAPTLPKDKTSILFGDLDFQALRPFENKENDTVFLGDPKTGVVIDELAFGKLHAYLCSAHNLTKKVEKAANEYAPSIIANNKNIVALTLAHDTLKDNLSNISFNIPVFNNWAQLPDLLVARIIFTDRYLNYSIYSNFIVITNDYYKFIVSSDSRKIYSAKLSNMNNINFNNKVNC
jgi:hypothetical protein